MTGNIPAHFCCWISLNDLQELKCIIELCVRSCCLPWSFTENSWKMYVTIRSFSTSCGAVFPLPLLQLALCHDVGWQHPFEQTQSTGSWWLIAQFLIEILGNVQWSSLQVESLPDYGGSCLFAANQRRLFSHLLITQVIFPPPSPCRIIRLQRRIYHIVSHCVTEMWISVLCSAAGKYCFLMC